MTLDDKQIKFGTLVSLFISLALKDMHTKESILYFMYNLHRKYLLRKVNV